MPVFVLRVALARTAHSRNKRGIMRLDFAKPPCQEEKDDFMGQYMHMLCGKGKRDSGCYSLAVAGFAVSFGMALATHTHTHINTVI